MKLFQIAEEEFLFQAVKPPTRFREGYNPLVLELVFTKYPDDVSSVQMLAPLGKSYRVIVLLGVEIQANSCFHSVGSIKKREDRNSLRLPRW